jgi:hypothetical protein
MTQYTPSFRPERRGTSRAVEESTPERRQFGLDSRIPQQIPRLRFASLGMTQYTPSFRPERRGTSRAVEESTPERRQFGLDSAASQQIPRLRFAPLGMTRYAPSFRPERARNEPRSGGICPKTQTVWDGLRSIAADSSTPLRYTRNDAIRHVIASKAKQSGNGECAGLLRATPTR